MSQLHRAENASTQSAQLTLQRPIIISQDHARQGATGQQVLYVLGFGIAGAILANMTVFIISFHSTPSV